jgi:hypothetical protein
MTRTYPNQNLNEDDISEPDYNEYIPVTDPTSNEIKNLNQPLDHPEDTL